MDDRRKLVIVTILYNLIVQIVADDVGDIISPNETRSGYEARMWLCCPPGNRMETGGCVEENVTSDIRSLVGDQGHYYQTLIEDPCAFSWMASSILEDFRVLPNGSIRGGESVTDFDNYCLFVGPKSDVYLAKVCRPWIERVYWQIFCLIFAIVVMLAVLVVYSIVPELGNLHGLVFRAYIIYYIGCHVGVIGQQLTAGSKTYDYLFTFFVFELHYFAGGCALWLNVMSFNIWRTFRSLRSVESHNRDRERKKFLWYSVYACVTPAILYMIIGAVMTYVPYFRELPLNDTIILWSCAGLLSTVILCNTFLFSLTAIRISKYERDVAHLTNGVDKHQDVDKQLFNLYVKLFLVTGCHTIMWVIWELYPKPFTTVMMIVLEVVQSLLIFVIFIWKGNVRRSVRKKVDGTLSRLKYSVRNQHVTPTTPTTPVTEC